MSSWNRGSPGLLISVGLVLLFSTVINDAGLATPVQKARKAASPEFKKPRSAKLFETAVALYKKGKFKTASSTFKKCRKGAKGKADRRVVDNWMRASEGAVVLVTMKRRVRAGDRRGTLFQGMEIARKYRGTPVQQSFEKFLEELSSQVLHRIEDFDRYNPHYTEKYGKVFIKANPSDPTSAVQGTGCYEWAQTPKKNAQQLSIKTKIPRDWSAFDGVLFWTYTYRGRKLDVIAMTPGKNKANKKNAWIVKHTPKPTGKWERVYLPLKNFQQNGDGDFSNVNALVLQIAGKSDFRLRIDSLSLVRKDPTTVRRRSKK